MINDAMREMVVDTAGLATWESICEGAGLSPSVRFASDETFPDSVTYDLVASASKVLDAPAAALLENFGAYWFGFSMRSGYGDLYGAAGANLLAFLQQLDAMHARLALAMPEFEAPSFRVSDVDEEGLKLHYHSKRPGLHPFVKGLVVALGDHFGQPVTMTLIQSRDEGASHEVFALKFATGVSQ